MSRSWLLITTDTVGDVLSLTKGHSPGVPNMLAHDRALLQGSSVGNLAILP